MLLVRNKEVITENDNGQVQVANEIDQLRQQFVKLKVQRDHLLTQIDEAEAREKEWRANIDRLNEDLARLENSLVKKDNEGVEQVRILEQKNNALVSDLKFMREENQKLHLRIKEANDNVLQMDQQVAEASSEQRQV